MGISASVLFQKRQSIIGAKTRDRIPPNALEWYLTVGGTFSHHDSHMRTPLLEILIL